MNLHARLKHFYSQPEFHSNTVKAVVKGGRVKFKVPFTEKAFDSLQQARDHIEMSGLTEFYSYGPEGQYSSRMLAHIAEREPGLRITQEVFNLEATDQERKFHQTRLRGGDFFGLSAVDNDRARLLRVFHDERGEMTQNQIDELLRGYGINMPGGTGKSAKRAKAMLAEKAIEMIDKDPLTVSVVSSLTKDDMTTFMSKERERLQDDEYFRGLLAQDDGISQAQWESSIQSKMGADGRITQEAREAALDLRTQQAIDRAQDGFMEVSRGRFEKVRDSLRAELDILDNQFGDTLEHGKRIRISQDRRKLMKALEAVEETLATGAGTYNARMLNFTMQIDGRDRGTIKNYIADLVASGDGLQIKANVVLRDDLGEGIDARIYYKNISTGGGTIYPAGPLPGEAPLPEGAIRYQARGPGYLTLDPFKRADAPFTRLEPTKLDVQTLASHAELYDIETIDQAVSDYHTILQRELEGMQQGKTPNAIIEMLESQLERTQDTDPVTYRRTKQVLDRLEGGAVISQDPYLANKVLDVLEKGVGRGRINALHRIPNMSMPGSYRGEVLPAHGVGAEVASGSIRYDARYGWLMNANDADEVYAAFGGFDFDDALNGMIRYDSNGNLKVIMTRQPNARGEIATFSLDQSTWESQQIVERNFKRSAQTNMEVAQLVDEREAYRKEIRELSQEIKQLSRDATMAPLPSTRTHDRHKKQILDARQQLIERRNSLRSLMEENKSKLVERTFRPMTGELGALGELGGAPTRRGSFRHYVDNRYFYEGERYLFDIFEGGQGPRPGVLYETLESLTDAGREEEFAERLRSTLRGLGAGEAIEAQSAMYQRVQDMLALQDSIKGERSAALGIYSNARMFMDHFLGANAAQLREAGINLQQITLLEQETVIDAYIQALRGGAGGAEEVKGLAEGMYRSAIRGVLEARSRAIGGTVFESGEARIGLDPVMREMKLNVTGGFNRLFEDIRSQMVEEGYDVAGVDVRDIFLEEGDPRARVSRVVQGNIRAQELVEEARLKVGLSDEIMSRKFGTRATRDAESLIRTYRRSIAESMGRPLVDYSQIAGLSLEDIRGLTAAEGMTEEAGRSVLRTLAGMTEITAAGEEVLGTRAKAAVARMGQIIQRQGGDFREMGALSEIGMVENVRRWALGDDPTMKIADVWARYGEALVADRETQDLLRGIVGDDQFKMLSQLQAGIDASGGVVGLTDLSADVQNRLRETGIVQTLDEAMYGPLDMRTYFQVDDELVNLGQWTQMAMSDKKYDQSARAIRSAFSNFASTIEQAALDPHSGITDELRLSYISAVEGTEKARLAQKAARDAVGVTSGDWWQKLKNIDVGGTKLGHVGMYAGIATVGAALLHRMKDDDVMPEDMQGPANLPGGNPYQDMSMQQGGGFDMSAPPAPVPSSARGVTYEIRSRGGDPPANLYEEIADTVGGGRVSGNVYDIEEVRSGFVPAGYTEGVF